MKWFILATGLVIGLAGMQLAEPVQAQSNYVRTMCSNKHGLDRRWQTASEGERKDAARKVEACIRSGGKS